MASTTRVILADDHGFPRQRISTSLKPRLEVVAEYAHGVDAAAAAHVLQPDIVIMGISMPGLNGIEATRRINRRSTSVKVLCVSTLTHPVFVMAALEAGASGYLAKESTIEELIVAIREINQGRVYLSPEVAVALPRETQAALAAHPPEPESPASVLTCRELEILRLVAGGLSNREIAFQLRLSPKTVSTHRQSMMDKLGIHNIAGITKYAIEEGLIGCDSPSVDQSSSTDGDEDR